MDRLTLVIGTKRYSSWSLRPWLALRQAGLAFDEVEIALRRPDTKAQILRHSPSGKVPLLIDGGLRVWESLAICEYVAELAPAARLWPEALDARAVARAVSAEMAAGFAGLRRALPMDLDLSVPTPPLSADAAADVARVLEVWNDCRHRFGAGGPFLFGRFSVADAMYAPVVTRFDTYSVAVDTVSAAYMAAVRELPAMAEWTAAARRPSVDEAGVEIVAGGAGV